MVRGFFGRRQGQVTKRVLLRSLMSGVFLLTVVPLLSAQDVSFFRIGTGSTSGTYYPIGTLIGSVISNPPGSRECEDGGSCGVPGLIAAGQTTKGSIANIEGVKNGSLETGLAQSDMVKAAYTGSGVYKDKDPVSDLRVIANLYPENIHLIVRRGAEIKSPQDLKGKRVSLDVPGSGTRENAKLILAAYGMSEDDIDSIPVNADKAVALMLNDELDAFFFVAGYPVTAVSQLAEAAKIDLLPIDGKVAEMILSDYSYFSPSDIPADTYRGIDTVPTLAVSTQWIVNADMEEDLVYDITRALWHPRHRGLLDNGHAKGQLIRLETALEGVSTPLHPGAARFYRDMGLLQN